MIRLESKTRCGVEPSGSFHLTSDAKGAERQTGDSDRCESVALNPASTRCRLSALRAQFGLLGRLNVRFWHIASFRCAAKFVAYWTNNGQRSARRLNGSATNDPSRTLAKRAWKAQYPPASAAGSRFLLTGYCTKKGGRDV